MKRALAALLRTLGLVPARRYDALLQEVSAIKTDRIAWKRRAAEAETRVRSLEKDLAHQARRLDKQVKAAETGPRREALKTLRARIEGAERELVTAREHLMVVETKLDILEGAANVLDARTRAQMAQRAGGSGAPV
jgi:predicted  nucleic acid-binding Zn-ribbon protein